MNGLFVAVTLILVNAEGSSASGGSDATVAADRAVIESMLPELVGLYKELHRAPELSFHEVKSAARLASELRSLGFEVTERFGGTGVVGLLRRGQGKTVLIRCDMDALPVQEKTGLDYASKVETRDDLGRTVSVMHACGHDMHMACWVGVARLLAKDRDWNGTVIMIAQPAEERGSGAKQMLDAGLFEKFPKPDFALALHCEAFLPVGHIGFTEGMMLANVDSVDVVIKGKGGHGAAPHTSIDPIVIAARFVLDVQTLVSREIDPIESAVVTVGSIHGGSKHNIIPAEVRLQLTVRSFKEETRKHLLDGIARIARSAAAAARAPEPVVTIDTGDFTPSLYNDPALTRRVVERLRVVLGTDRLRPLPAMMGGEDFSRYGRAGVPIFLFRLGTVSEDRLRRAKEGGEPLPSLHSDAYYPLPEASLRTGVLSMASAVRNLLGP